MAFTRKSVLLLATAISLVGGASGVGVAEESVQRTEISFDPPIFRPWEYTFGWGGDLNTDGLVDGEDLKLLEEALETPADIPTDYDINRDGRLDDADRGFLIRVIEGLEPVVSESEIVTDPKTREPTGVAVSGYNADPVMMIAVAGYSKAAELVENRKDGGFTATRRLTDVEIAVLDEVGRAPVSVHFGARHIFAPALMVRHATFQVADWYFSPGARFYDIQATEEPTDSFRDPAGTAVNRSCCITRLWMRGFFNNHKISAWGFNGQLAKGSRGDISLKGDGSRVTISPGTPTVRLKLESRGENLVDRTFDCRTAQAAIDAKTQFKETITPPPGSVTRPRARNVLQLMKMEVERPCRGAAPTKPNIAVFDGKTHDNAEWDEVDKDGNRTGKKRTGSGAKLGLAVTPAELRRFQCVRACWVQSVKSEISSLLPDKIKAGKLPRQQTGWKTEFQTGWHNDNLNMNKRTIGGAEYPWFCYAATHQHPRHGLAMTDGPHFVHSNEYRFNGKKVTFPDGTLIRRKTDFHTALLCLEPAKILDAFSWTVDTVFTVGGNAQTLPIGLQRVNSGVKSKPFKRGMDPRRMRKFLEKKRKNL